MSRVRLAASEVWVVSPRRLPRHGKAYVHAHIHPSRRRFTALLAIGSVDHQIELNVFWAAGPCTPRHAHVVTQHGLWYRDVSASGH